MTVVSGRTEGHTDQEAADAESGATPRAPDIAAPAASVPRPARWRRMAEIDWVRAWALVLLPVTGLALALCAGYAKWRTETVRSSELAGLHAVQAAREGAAAMLAYQSDEVEMELNSALDRLTGEFRDSYEALINDLVIPGSKEKGISAVTDIPAAGVVSADEDHAVVLVFVDQTTTIGADPPTRSVSSVRVTLENVENRWLISGFDPV